MPKALQRKLTNLLYIVYVCLGLFLAFVITYGFRHPDSYHELETVLLPWKTAVVMAGGIFLFLFLLYAAFSLGASLSERNKRTLLIAGSAAAFLLQLFLVLRYPLQIWWDNTSVLSSAISVVSGDKSCFDVIYFNQVGHQNCFLLLTSVFVAVARLFKIPEAMYTVYFSLIDLIFMDLGVAIALLTLAKVKGEALMRRVWLLALLCPGLYLWAGYYYTTNLSIFFLALYLYLVYLAWEKKRSRLFYLMTGCVAAFGMQLRMTLLLSLIATVLFVIFRRPKAPLRAAVFTLAGMAAMLLLLNLSYEKMNPDYDKDSRFPVTHWLMMGAQGNGEYSDADLAYTSSFATAQEKKEATKAEYVRRLKEAGPVGLLKLAARKTANNWAYGNHSYYPLFHRYDRLSDLIWTPDHQIMFYLEQVYHLSLFLLVLGSVLLQGKKLFLARKEEACEVGFDNLFMITLLGGFCFYLLWETFPYYSVGFLGLLLQLSADALGVRVSGNVGDRRLKAAAAAALLSAVLIIGIFAATDFPVSVKPVVTQKKLDRMLSLGEAKKAEQTFVADRPFDTISFWIGKEDVANPAGGEYEIVLQGEKSGEVLREKYDTADMGRVDEYTRTFPRVETKGERFSLTIERIGEQPCENELTLGGYDLPVEAYLYGAFSLDTEAQSSELFFTVTDGGPDSVIRLYE